MLRKNRFLQRAGKDFCDACQNKNENRTKQEYSFIFRDHVTQCILTQQVGSVNSSHLPIILLPICAFVPSATACSSQRKTASKKRQFQANPMRTCLFRAASYFLTGTWLWVASATRRTCAYRSRCYSFNAYTLSIR